MIRHAKSIPLLLAFAVGIFLFSCKDDGGPPPPNVPDTTSHNFVFSLDTLGDGNSSALNDVAIISENNVWAVGEIHKRDSVGGYSQPAYGLAVWNGSAWQLRRLSAPGPGFVSNLRPRGIFAFSATDIWFASGGVFRWDGQSITSYWINSFPGNPNPILDPGQTAEKLWGTSSSNLYAVGSRGAIAHFNGSTWQKLASGTTVDIQDIWGTSNAGMHVILAVASMGPQIPQARRILRIQNNQVTFVPDSGLPLDLEGIWFSDTTMYYVVGEGVFTSRNLSSWQRNVSHPSEYKEAIRGNNWNDIFVAGSFGLTSHYNGSSWRHYTGNELPSFFGKYQRVALSGNRIFAVGWMNDKAVVLRGRRN